MFRQPNVVGDGTTGRWGAVSGETCPQPGRRACAVVVSGAGIRVSIVPRRGDPREGRKAKPLRGKGDRKVEA